MAISLRANEEIRGSANFHWSSYIKGAGMGFILTVMVIANHALWPFLLIAWVPFTYKLLSNKCKHYVVTNQRLYIEDGIIAKRKKDIPLQKVNDLEVSQGILQRMLGTGSLFVLTGNDQPTQLLNIDKPEAFKDHLSEALGEFSKKH